MELAPSEKATLDEMGRDLRTQGWATHVTVERLLRDWKELAESVDRYTLTVDDYTNDLTARDGLELVLARCAEPLRSKIRVIVEAADKEFRSRTLEDDSGAVARHFRVTDVSGWWWRRKPARGPLADYLAGHS
jgi:hypothetical protein